VVETLEVGDVVMVEKLVRLENPIQRVRSVEREETDFWGFDGSVGGR
jgi:signal peptidase I